MKSLIDMEIDRVVSENRPWAETAYLLNQIARKVSLRSFSFITQNAALIGAYIGLSFLFPSDMSSLCWRIIGGILVGWLAISTYISYRYLKRCLNIVEFWLFHGPELVKKIREAV